MGCGDEAGRGSYRRQRRSRARGRMGGELCQVGGRGAARDPGGHARLGARIGCAGCRGRERRARRPGRSRPTGRRTSRSRTRGCARRSSAPCPADGIRARAVVESGEDVATAILAAAGEADADVVVVGSSGMRGRKQFLLGNVANRVTHLADCTVVVVNTTTGEPAPRAPPTRAGCTPGRARSAASSARSGSASSPGGCCASRATRTGRGGCGRRSRAWDRPSASSARSSRPVPT